MLDPFAAALVPLFNGPRSAAANYESVADGPLAGAIRIIKTTATTELQLGEIVVSAGSTLIEIRQSDVAEPEAGDRLTIAADLWEIMGEPRLSDEGICWMCEVKLIG